MQRLHSFVPLALSLILSELFISHGRGLSRFHGFWVHDFPHAGRDPTMKGLGFPPEVLPRLANNDGTMLKSTYCREVANIMEIMEAMKLLVNTSP